MPRDYRRNAKQWRCSRCQQTAGYHTIRRTKWFIYSPDIVVEIIIPEIEQSREIEAHGFRMPG